MTIVNQYPVMESAAQIWVIAILTVFTGIFLVITMIALSDKFWKVAIVVGTFLLLFGISLGFALTTKVESGRNRYECLIDDTTPFVEVVENYDIVGRRGDLWILEDRDEH